MLKGEQPLSALALLAEAARMAESFASEDALRPPVDEDVMSTPMADATDGRKPIAGMHSCVNKHVIVIAKRKHAVPVRQNRLLLHATLKQL